MKKVIATIIIIFLIISALAGISLYLLYEKDKNHIEASFEQAAFSETADDIPNRYRGFYEIAAISLASDDELDRDDFHRSCPMVLLEIKLSAFKNTEIPEPILNRLDRALRFFEELDKPVILRLLYDWDGNAADDEPSSVETVLSHLRSCAPVINDHTDNICCMQGVLLGAYGEMHSSELLTSDNMCLIMKTEADCIAESIPLSVRTPSQYRTIIAKHPGLSGRLGLYNDGLLGSMTDLGTYRDSSDEETDDLSPRTRDEELAFQNELCRTVLNGGEAIYSDELSEQSVVLETLRTMHISYLDLFYDEKEIAWWKSLPYEGDEAVYSDGTVLDYIRKHLGYRYSPVSVSLDASGDIRENASVTALFRNTGFASSYRDFPVRLYLDGKDNEGRTLTIELPAFSNTSAWNGAPNGFSISDADIPSSDGSVGTVETELFWNEIPDGSYSLFLEMTDPISGESIRFSDENDNDGTLFLGTLSVKRGILDSVIEKYPFFSFLKDLPMFQR